MEPHQNLFAVSDADFEATVLKAEQPVVVDFWAEWCPPCRAIAPFYERLSSEYAGKITFAKMDIDAHPLAASRLGVQGFPTFLIFHHGKVQDWVIGANPSGLKRALERVLAETSDPTSAPAAPASRASR